MDEWKSEKRKFKPSGFPTVSPKPNNLRAEFGTDQNATFLEKQLAAMSRKNTIYNQFVTDQRTDFGQTVSVASPLARESQAVVDNLFQLHNEHVDDAITELTKTHSFRKYHRDGMPSDTAFTIRMAKLRHDERLKSQKQPKPDRMRELQQLSEEFGIQLPTLTIKEASQLQTMDGLLLKLMDIKQNPFQEYKRGGGVQRCLVKARFVQPGVSER